jgi:hypothetical protein
MKNNLTKLPKLILEKEKVNFENLIDEEDFDDIKGGIGFVSIFNLWCWESTPAPPVTCSRPIIKKVLSFCDSDCMSKSGKSIPSVGNGVCSTTPGDSTGTQSDSSSAPKGLPCGGKIIPNNNAIKIQTKSIICFD